MLTQLPQVEPVDQVVTFAYAVIMGIALCLLYDLLRCFRLLKSCGNLRIFIQDMIYFSVSAGIVFCFLLIRCHGELRYYVLLGTLIGWLFFRFTVSRWVLAITTKVIRFIGRIIVALFSPLNRFFAVIFQKIHLLTRKAANYIKNIYKRKKKPLENDTAVDV